MGEPVRLQKFLSNAGIASRREAEAMILAGRVRVGGNVVRELGVKVDPDADRVQVDGRDVTAQPRVWIALHKPAGYVSTRHDPQGRPTIYDLLPDRLRGLFHVGRLDRDSEGLILLTNEGDTAHRLLHPRFGVDRVYLVDAAGDVSPATVRRLFRGVPLEDGIATVLAAERLPTRLPNTSRIRVTLREGRKREVRRIFEAIGHPVRRLVRIRFGPIKLGSLEPGRWRGLSPAELAALPALPAPDDSPDRPRRSPKR